MKTKIPIFIFICLFLGCFKPCFPGESSQVPYTLPEPVIQVLKGLEETYRILDITAGDVWPGWKDYRKYPFHYHFQNGLSILVNHPKPPGGFELAEGITVDGKPVYIDSREISTLPLKSPLCGGGGILSLGVTDDGKPIELVDLHLETAENAKPGELKFQSDRQILINIHELFHLFQMEWLERKFGALTFNPTVDFSYYSGIEGLALEKAYLEPDPAKAKEYIKDFLLAQELKRKATMTDLQANQESADHISEGTAMYSEVRTLEILRKGYTPDPSMKTDPFFSGFSDIDFFLKRYQDTLRESSKSILECLSKCYDYGCFEALLLQRFFPGWQTAIAKVGLSMDQELRKQLPIAPQEADSIKKQWETRYDAAGWRKKCTQEIGERDRYYKSITGRKGKTYIINFKPISEFAYPKEKKKSYQIGLIDIYPEGMGDLKINDIEITGLSVPMSKNELYHLKIVDTKWKKGQKPYSLQYEKQLEGNIYAGAVITTPIFTIKAPKVKIKESAKRVKFIMLSRVKEN